MPHDDWELEEQYQTVLKMEDTNFEDVEDPNTLEYALKNHINYAYIDTPEELRLLSEVIQWLQRCPAFLIKQFGVVQQIDSIVYHIECVIQDDQLSHDERLSSIINALVNKANEVVDHSENLIRLEEFLAPDPYDDEPGRTQLQFMIDTFTDGQWVRLLAISEPKQEVVEYLLTHKPQLFTYVYTRDEFIDILDNFELEIDWVKLLGTQLFCEDATGTQADAMWLLRKVEEFDMSRFTGDCKDQVDAEFPLLPVMLERCIAGTYRIQNTMHFNDMGWEITIPEQDLCGPVSASVIIGSYVTAI